MPLRLATHNWMRPEPIHTTLQRMQATGIHTLEISGHPDQYNTTELRPLLRSMGLSCWGAVTMTDAQRDLSAADPAIRAAAVAYMKRVVTLSKELDGEMVTVVPTAVGKVHPQAGPDEEWAWVVEGLKEVHAHAEKEGIRIAIEPLNRFETYLINRSDQALALADAVGPMCGVCLDLFHMNIEEVDLLEVFRSAKGRIFDIHIADNNRFAPGMGSLDFASILRVIREVNYQGALALEFVATIDRSPLRRYGIQTAQASADMSAEQLKFITEHGSTVLADDFYTSLFVQSVRHLQPLL